MNLFTALLLAKKKLEKFWAYITNEIVNKPTKNFNVYGDVIDGPLYGGFANNQYILVTESIPSFTNFKIISKAKTTTGSNNTLFCMNYGQECDFGIRKNSIASIYLDGWIEGTTSIQSNIWYWYRIEYIDNVFKFFTLLDNEYTLETLPSLENWNYECSLSTDVFTGKNIYIGTDIYYSDEYWRGNISNFQVTINNTEWFNIETAQEGIDYTLTSNISYLPEKTFTNFSLSNYLQLDMQFKPEDKSWEWNFKIKPTSLSSRERYIAGCVDNNYSILLCNNSSNYFTCYISSNGSSWDIANGSNMVQMLDNTIQYIKLGYNGTKYYMSSSLDGETYTEAWSVESFAKVKPVNLFRIGNTWTTSDNNRYFIGQIFMDECSISIDNKKIWVGYKYPSTIGDSIKINSGMGLSNYEWSAYPAITTTENEFTLNNVIKSKTIDSSGQGIFGINKPNIPTNNITLKTKATLYADYTNNINDVYLEYGKNINTSTDYRFTNYNFYKGPGWTAFSQGKLIGYLDKTYPTVNSFEIVWHFKSGSSLGNYERIFNWCQAGNYGDSRQGPYLQIYSGGVELVFYNGSYTSIQAAVGAVNTEYWVKFNYDGTNWYSYNSMDGITWTLYNSSTPSYTPFFNIINFDIGRREDGYDGHTIFKGNEFLQDCYIKINGDMAWNGAIQPLPTNKNVYSSIGNLTNGVYTGGSDKYLILNNYIYTQNYDKWEIELKYTHDTNPNNWNAIIGQVTTDYSGLTLNVRSNGDLQINLKNSGNSWIIADSSTGLTLSQGTTYYMKLGYDSSLVSNQYYFKYKLTENDNYIDQWGYTSSYKNYQTDVFCFVGSKYYSSSRYNTGSIDLDYLKITCDNNIIFNGATAMKSDYSIVGTPLYLDNASCYGGGGSGASLYFNNINYPTFNTLDIVLKMKFSTIRQGAIFYNQDVYYYSPLIAMKSDGTLWVSLSSTGEEWDICSQSTASSTKSLTTDTWYWIKLSFDGTQYKLDVSTTGAFNGEEENFVTVSSPDKLYYTETFISLFNEGTASWYTIGVIDTSGSYVKGDNSIVYLDTAKITSQFYEKTSPTTVEPITVDAGLNSDNKIVIDNSIYNRDSSKDIIDYIDYGELDTDTTDDNKSFTISVDNVNDAEIVSSSYLTQKTKIIDNIVYHKFDIEYLDGYITTINVDGKNYEKYEVPLYFTDNKYINITLQNPNDLTQGYNKTIRSNIDVNYKKQKLTISLDQTFDNATVIVNDCCIWNYSNSNQIVIDLYNGDKISYVISKDNYETIAGLYIVDNVYAASTNIIELSMTRVYKYTFNVTPNDAKIELTSTNTYAQGSNWIQVYENATIDYTISKEGYKSVSGREGYEIISGNIYYNTTDKTINVTLVSISENNIVGKADYLNVKNNRAIIYKDTNDDYIASAENTRPLNSNYPYVTETPLLPLDTAKSWEIRTAYRYMGGGSGPLIFGSSKDDWHYGGVNLYCYNSRFRLDFALSKNKYLLETVDLGGSSWQPELGYEYKFKVGQIIEDNQWTANDGGGTRNTIYVDAWKSDRNTTLNPTLSANGTVGGNDYACENSINSSTAYLVINGEDGIVNPTLSANGTMGGSTPACTANYQSQPAWWAFDGDTTTGERCWWTHHGVTSESNPAWITYYYPTAIKLSKAVLYNEVATPSSPKTGILQASNDNSTWVDLANINVTSNASGLQTTIIVNSNTAYQYYRFYFTASWDTGGVALQEIKLYQAIEQLPLPTVDNPVWLTYYTPTAIKPKSFTVVNDDTLNNMKDGVIEGSTDNTNWTILYTIINRTQTKNLSETYIINTEDKYNYFRLKITTSYTDYEEQNRDYFIDNNSQLTVSLKDNFFNQCLYQDNKTGIAEFRYVVSSSDSIVLDNLNGTPYDLYLRGTINDWDTDPDYQFKYDSTYNVYYLDNVTWSGEYKFASSDWSTIDLGSNGTSTIPFNSDYTLSRYGSDLNYDSEVTARRILLDPSTRVVKIITSNYIEPGQEIDDDENAGYPSGWSLNKNSVEISNYLNITGNPQNSDSITVYYDINEQTLSTTSTNIKQFIIDGFPFTYSGDYTRLYTRNQTDKQYNIVDGELIENPNYIALQNPYVSVPLSFLNSPLNLSYNYSLGHINLSKTECYINGQLYWSAIKDFNVDDTVILNRGYGLVNSEWTVNNNAEEFKGDLSIYGKVVSINNDDITVEPLYITQGQAEIVSNEDSSNINTLYELPTKTITLNVVNEGTNIDDANITLNTYLNSKTNVNPYDGYRRIHFETMKDKDIELYVNSQKYLIDNDNPVINLDVLTNDFITNNQSYYSYIVKENNNVVEQSDINYIGNNNVSVLVHIFKVRANVQNATITYTINNVSTVTTDGSVECYSGQVVNWKIEKTGYITEIGSYTIPLECLNSTLFSVNITMDSAVTLTLNSSETNSVYTLECNGYEQSNNTITTKEGSTTLIGDNLVESSYVLVGNITVEEK